MDSRVLAVSALVALLAFAAPVSALADATPSAVVDNEECGGRIAIGCEHWSADGPCVLYMNGRCIIWVTQ